MNLNLGMQGNMMFQPVQQPVFKQYAVGTGIDKDEYNTIINSAGTAYTGKKSPLSTNTATLIKTTIGGEWFVFVCPVGSKDYDFCVSSVSGGDFMSFSLDSTLFQVARIK